MPPCRPPGVRIARAAARCDNSPWARGWQIKVIGPPYRPALVKMVVDCAVHFLSRFCRVGGMRWPDLMVVARGGRPRWCKARGSSARSTPLARPSAASLTLLCQRVEEGLFRRRRTPDPCTASMTISWQPWTLQLTCHSSRTSTRSLLPVRDRERDGLAAAALAVRAPAAHSAHLADAREEALRATRVRVHMASSGC